MDISTTLTTLNIWFFAKVFVMFGLAMYVIFAGIVIKQVNSMRATVSLGVDRFVETLAWAHFLLVLFVLVVSFVFL